MKDLLTFLDVETPNKRNDRICSIAVVQTDAMGSVVERRSYLVNPESQFDDINIRIHGIKPVDVRGAMTLPDLWSGELGPILHGTRLVAHNARFDLCVLSKAFDAYGITVSRPVFADTMEMSRRMVDGLPDAKLPTVCRRLGISLGSHHRAESDADACRRIFWSLIGPGDDFERYFSPYTFERGGHRPVEHRERQLSRGTRDMAALVSLLSNVIRDGTVSIDEAISVLGYVVSHESLASDPTVSKVADELQRALSDGDLNHEEARDLEDLFSRVVNPIERAGARPTGIEFQGKKFVLTGNFMHGSKDDVKGYIQERGGIIVGSPSRRVSYVVVGGCGSEAYAMGSYGTKVKAAMDLQASGAPIRIIQEDELYFEGD